MTKLLFFTIFSFLLASCGHGHRDWHGKKMEKKAAKFQAMDANGDGIIGQKEWNNSVAEKFVEIDADKDQKISQEEFLNHHVGKHKKCKDDDKLACRGKKCTGASCKLYKKKCKGSKLGSSCPLKKNKT